MQSTLFFVSVLFVKVLAEGTFEVVIHPSFTSSLHVCLKVYQTTVTYYDECSFGVKDIGVVQGQESIVKFPFSVVWVKDFTLIIKPRNASHGVELEPFVQRDTAVGNEDFKRISHSWDNNNRMNVAYRVACSPNHYGDRCFEFCEPSDNQFGHYNCSHIGEKICHPGWSGERCDQPVCSQGCKNGTCSAPGVCDCDLGFKGNSCDQCVPRRGCLNGACDNGQPSTCKCKPGYGGIYCNLDLEYCTRHRPCNNGGLCRNQNKGQYTCECPYGFSGRNCEIPMTHEAFICHQPNICLNGGSCIATARTDFKCLCPPGFDGKHCEFKMNMCDAQPCENGGQCTNSKGSYECKCQSGFFGYNCQMKLEKRVEEVQAGVMIALLLVFLAILFGMVLIYKRMRKLLSHSTSQNALNHQRDRFDDAKSFSDSRYKAYPIIPETIPKKCFPNETSACSESDYCQRYTTGPSSKTYLALPQIDANSIYEEIDIHLPSQVSPPVHAPVPTVCQNIPYSFPV